MALQTLPIIEGEVGAGPTLYDRPLLGPSNTLRPTFTIREAFDGTTIVMRYAWQQTADMWVQDLRTTGGDLITQGLGVVASGVDLWAPIQFGARMPGGQLWVAWGDQRPRRPLRHDWRGDATLYYRPAALVLELAGSDRELR